LARLSQKPELVIYSPSAGEFSVDLTRIPGDLTVEWLNPANGQIRHEGKIKGGKLVHFTHSFHGDAYSI
jgi:hypothetical protein